jgi:hypothetical protein
MIDEKYIWAYSLKNAIEHNENQRFSSIQLQGEKL